MNDRDDKTMVLQKQPLMVHDGKILVKGARVYDPSQGWRGEVRDLYLAEGRVSEPFADPQRIVDAGGRALLAGATDPYCQIAALGQTPARLFAGNPSPEDLGRTYARMGYVHVHHPFTSLLTAGLVRHALGRIPFVDTSTCASIDLRDMGQLIRANQPAQFSLLARALIRRTGSIGISLPFPYLRHKQRHYLQKNLSSRKVIAFLSLLADPEILPIHLWGIPGLLDTQIDRPDRFHIAGLGMALDSESSVEKAKEFLRAGGSADLGPSTGQEQFVVCPSNPSQPAGLSMDVGMQTPLAYCSRPMPLGDTQVLACWSLLGELPPSCRLALSASGPAGGQFAGMASVSTWLLDPKSRPRELAEALKGCRFDLNEWARLTRLEPARCLGLDDVGHLRVGARASVAVYDLESAKGAEETTAALRDCWCLIKDGVIVREDGAFTGQEPHQQTRCREVEVDSSALRHTDLLQNATVRYEHLGLCPTEVDRSGRTGKAVESRS